MLFLWKYTQHLEVRYLAPWVMIPIFLKSFLNYHLQFPVRPPYFFIKYMKKIILGICLILFPLFWIFHFNICFLFHLLLTASVDSYFVWRGCYSLSCPAYPFHIQPSNLYPLYLDIFKADNYILLCKHDCPLCFIENQLSDKLFVSPDNQYYGMTEFFSWWFSSVLTGR